MVCKLAYNNMGQEPYIRLALLNGMIRHGGGNNACISGCNAVRRGIFGSYVHIDNQLHGPVFQFLGYLLPYLFKRSSCFRAYLLFFGDIQKDLYPFQMVWYGNAARVIELNGTALFYFNLLLRDNLRLRLWSWLIKQFLKKTVKHHLPGINLLRSFAIYPSQQLLNLMLKLFHCKLSLMSAH
jgi:hypothetical protein